jgi:hypothetical protein
VTTRRTSSPKLAVLSAALALAACADGTRAPSARANEETRTGRRADAIEGGMADATSTFAVGVVDESNVTCSGTLIAPNLVLTARHCVADDDGGSAVDCASDKFSAPFAASTFRVTTDATLLFDTAAYHVSKIIVPTSTLFCGNDIALLVLAENIPAAVARPATPAIDPPLTDRAKYGEKITAIGYGTTSPSASDDGQRRRRTGISIDCIPGDATIGCTPADFAMTADELAAGNGLCSGDSGSGAYLPSSLTTVTMAPIVMGVLSRAAETQGSCSDAVYERTDTASAFLIAGAKDAAAIGKYAAPAWADPNAAQPDGGAPDGGAEPTSGEPDAGVADDASLPGQTTTTTSGCSVGRSRGPSDGRVAVGALLVGLVTFLRCRSRARSGQSRGRSSVRGPERTP